MSTSVLNNSVLFEKNKTTQYFDFLLKNFRKKFSVYNGKFKLRKVCAEDESAVKDLIHRIHQEKKNIELDFSTIEEELNDLSKQNDLAGSMFNVLEHGSSIIGTVGISPVKNKIFNTQETCEIKNLYLDSDYRKMGKGKFMFKYVLSQAKKLGYQQCIVKIETKNEHLLYFLLKEGFEHVFQENDDIIDYQLVLTKPI